MFYDGVENSDMIVELTHAYCLDRYLSQQRIATFE